MRWVTSVAPPSRVPARGRFEVINKLKRPTGEAASTVPCIVCPTMHRVDVTRHSPTNGSVHVGAVDNAMGKSGAQRNSEWTVLELCTARTHLGRAQSSLLPYRICYLLFCYNAARRIQCTPMPGDSPRHRPIAERDYAALVTRFVVCVPPDDRGRPLERVAVHHGAPWLGSWHNSQRVWYSREPHWLATIG